MKIDNPAHKAGLLRKNMLCNIWPKFGWMRNNS